MEIKCVLLDRNVFTTGETLRCRITFCNDTDMEQSLAWASAQIHCICTSSPHPLVDTIRASLSNSSSTLLSPSSSTTSLHSGSGEGKEIYASKPQILFVDLKLDGCSHKTIVYQAKIPSNLSLPPSYVGQHIKYSYKIMIGTQKVNSNIKFVKIPFRVIPGSYSDAIVSPIPPTPVAIANGDLDQRNNGNLTNPFLSSSKISNPEQDEASTDDGRWDSSACNIANKKSFRCYEIANLKGKLAKLCLFKNGFQLGEEVVGNFEFYESDIRCVEYSVSLNSEEIINSDVKIRKSKGKISCYAKSHDVTMGYESSNLALQIPLHVTPSFRTEICELKWFLHFIFVIAPKMETQKDEEWNGPNSLHVETMVWDLPITLFHTNPNIVAQGLLQPMSQRLVHCQI